MAQKSSACHWPRVYKFEYIYCFRPTANKGAHSLFVINLAGCEDSQKFKRLIIKL